jgi:hypothetical protein
MAKTRFPQRVLTLAELKRRGDKVMADGAEAIGRSLTLSRESKEIRNRIDITHHKVRKPAPFEFVLDALAPLRPSTRPMFGCLAVYVGEKIVLVLRDKRDATTPDNGVWLATTREHHDSLRREFPNMRSIQVLGKEVTGWQILPVDAPDFEEAVMRVCDLITARDPRIGKVPGAKKKGGGGQAGRLKRRPR